MVDTTNYKNILVIVAAVLALLSMFAPVPLAIAVFLLAVVLLV